MDRLINAIIGLGLILGIAGTVFGMILIGGV